MFEALRKTGYQIELVSHALAILEIDFPDAAKEIEDVILNQSVPIEEIIRSGGGETKGTQRLRNGLTAKGWVKETFTIKKTINDEPRESISHQVDHVRVFDRPDGRRYRIALEIEWNNLAALVCKTTCKALYGGGWTKGRSIALKAGGPDQARGGQSLPARADWNAGFNCDLWRRSACREEFD